MVDESATGSFCATRSGRRGALELGCFAALAALMACELDDRRPTLAAEGSDASATDSSGNDAGSTPTPPAPLDSGDGGALNGVGNERDASLPTPAGCSASEVACGAGVCRAAGSCCNDEECGGAGVGTCSESGQCTCQTGGFGARCAGRLLGLGVARPQQDSDSAATAVSGDGRVVVGWSGLVSVPIAARWAWESGQAESLGTLPGSQAAVPRTVAAAVSQDGSVVVGDGTTRVSDQDATVPFRWTQAAGVVALPAIEFTTATHAEAVTADGETVVGWGETDGGAQAGTRWRDSNGDALESFSASPDPLLLHATLADGSLFGGELAFLPVLFDPAAQGAERFISVPTGSFAGGFIAAISANATQLVGVLDGVAVRWINASPTQALSPGNPLDLGVGEAHDVSDDGTIVGSSGEVAVVWSAAGVRHTLLEVLEAEGATGLAGWTFTSANGISDDGLVIVGAGERAGRQEAWLVRLSQAL